MAVLSKTRLGPYEIQRLVGRGGMGEVYLARDVRLQRTVAIKIICEQLSQSPGSRERFQHEAKAASRLSHPNICTVYDVGEWEGREFLAMEYVEGRPLSELLAAGPLPISELLNFFLQLAGALEEAHSHGIIHRDIKPGNILITDGGQVKLTDFGLAKQVPSAVRAAAAGSGGETTAETASWLGPDTSLTSPGTAIGTVSYMSPEQARGEELDTRTDLFSCGVVLYEAATGKRAFDGATTAVIFAALLKDEPTPALELNSSLPSLLGEVIGKLLEKDRRLRYQHASDLTADLHRLKRLVKGDSTGRAAIKRQRRHGWKILAAAVLAMALLATVWVAWRHRTSEIRIPKPEQLTAASMENPIIQSTLSPDGKTVAYGDEFGIQLYLIATRESRTVLPAQGSSNATRWWPVDWFPDGNHLLVNSTETTSQGPKLAVWVVSAHSGRAVKLREDCLADAVSPDGSLIAFTTGGSSLREEIWVMGPQGEAARRLVQPRNTGEVVSIFSSLRWSPDGKRIAFRQQDSPSDRASVLSVSLEGKPPTLLAAEAERWGDFRWLANDRMLFSYRSQKDSEDMNLWEVQVDPRSGSPARGQRQLTDWDGFRIENLSLSRDGTRLSFDKTSAQTDVLVAQLRAKGLAEAPRRLTLDDYNDTPYAWAYDSKTVFYTSERQGRFLILKQKNDETQADEIVSSSNIIGPVRLTPDGSALLYLDHPATGDARLMLAQLSGGLPRELTHPGLIANVACSIKPATNCLAGTLEVARSRFVFWSFTPPNRDFRRLFVISSDLRKGLSWTISPDGRHIAINKNYPDHAQIDIYSLEGTLERSVPVNGFNQFFSIDWAPGGSWLVGTSTATGCSLLRVHEDGHYQPLLNIRARGLTTFAIPSPDGKNVAIWNWTVNRNVWVVDPIGHLL